MKDKNGNTLKVGDIVHNRWGYDLIVCKDDNEDYYGKLVCEKGHSCENIPYALYSPDIELLHKKKMTAHRKKVGIFDRVFSFIMFACFAFFAIMSMGELGKIIGFEQQMKDLGVAIIFGAVYMHLAVMDTKKKDKEEEKDGAD